MRFLHFETLASTNVKARLHAEETGDLGPLWIIADQQSSGRGRREREWVSPKGNLYTTGLYPAGADLTQTARLSFAAALAVSDSLVELGVEGVSIKWPNDILVDGAKAAGLLLESGTVHGQAFVLIGIGVNIASSPEGLGRAVTHVNAHCADPVMPRDMLERIATRFSHWRSVLETQGFTPLQKAWTAKAAGLGQAVTARLPNSDIHGIALGLSDQGALLIRLPDGTQTSITAGDVFFTPNAES